MINLVAHGIMLDDIVFPDGQTQMGILGGGGPQTAWGAAATLGSGETVGLIAGVHHGFESTSLQPLHAAQLDLEGIRYNSIATPRAWQVLEFDGERKHIWRISPEILPYQLERGWDVAPESYQSAKFFHWGIHPDDASQDIAWAKKLVENGVSVSLEPFIPSVDPLSLEELTNLLEYCAVFSTNYYEATKISGIYDDDKALIRHYQKAGCRYLLLRKDENGSEVWDCQHGEGVSVQAIKTTVVDVVGAGNAYTGAFLAQIENGIEEAICHASATASYLIEQVGLPHTLPQGDEYNRRVEEAKKSLSKLKIGI